MAGWAGLALSGDARRAATIEPEAGYPARMSLKTE